MANGKIRYRLVLYGFSVGTYETLEEAEEKKQEKEDEISEKTENNRKLPKEKQKSNDEILS